MLKLGRFLGIPVYAHWSTLLLAAYIAFFVYPSYGANVSDSTVWRLVENLAVAFILIGTIVVHELAHSFVARRLHIPVASIVLFGLGAGAMLEHEPRRARDEFFIAVVGPLASFVIAGICFLLKSVVAEQGSWDVLKMPLQALAWMNLILAIFNLVPAFPMDGGRVLRSAFWALTANYRKATVIAVYAGFGFAALMGVLGLSVILQGSLVGVMWLFLAYFLYASGKQYLANS